VLDAERGRCLTDVAYIKLVDELLDTLLVSGEVFRSSHDGIGLQEATSEVLAPVVTVYSQKVLVDSNVERDLRKATISGSVRHTAATAVYIGVPAVGEYSGAVLGQSLLLSPP
jgi:hypothetical protein